MVTGTARVKNKNGIHLRLAGELVKAATQFRSQIMVAKDAQKVDAQEVDAKSILGVAGLGAEFGSELTFRITGDDEQAALGFLINLVENEFVREAG